MPDPYTLNLTAAQIDAALQAANDSDQAPAASSTNLVNSGRIYTAIQAETTARTAADAALDGRVTAVEAPPVFAKFSKDDFSFSSNLTISGYTEVDPDGIASESSGVITVTGTGVYMVVYSLSGLATGSSPPDYFSVTPKINGAGVAFGYYGAGNSGFNPDSFSHTEFVSSAGSFTASLLLTEFGTASGSSTYARISIIKL